MWVISRFTNHLIAFALLESFYLSGNSCGWLRERARNGLWKESVQNQLKHRSSISNTMHDHLWSYFKASAQKSKTTRRNPIVHTAGHSKARLLKLWIQSFPPCPSIPWSPFFPSGHRIASEVSFSPCLVTSENCGAWCMHAFRLSGNISARHMHHQDDLLKLPWLPGCAAWFIDGFSSEPKRLIQA